MDIPDQNKSKIDDLLAAAEEIFIYPNAKQAFELSRELEILMKSHQLGLSNQQADKLQMTLARLRFIALPLMSSVEVYNLFRQHLDEVLALDIDLLERVKSLLITLPIEDRDGVKAKIAEAIEQNQQRITYIDPVTQGTRSMPANLDEWIKYYYGFMQGKMSDMMREVEFFTKSPAIIRLSAEERNKIKRIFTLYRFLHYSSMAPEGFEEGIIIREKTGELKAFSNGNFETIKSISRQHNQAPPHQIKSSTVQNKPDADHAVKSPLDLLKQKYQSYRGQRQHILQAEDNLIVKTRGDVDRIEREMATGTRDGNKYMVIACLKVLARQGVLVMSLKKNSAWLDATGEYVQKKYSQQSKPGDVAYALSNQKIQPESPVLVAEFLQYVLQEKLRMGENDSALIGSEIGQLMGGRYQGMAYGDSTTGNFQWAKNKIENQMFVSEFGQHFV